MCNCFATTAGLWGWALLAILTHVEPPDGEDDLPAGIVKREVSTKPSPDLGEFVELRLGDVVVRTRQYYDGDKQVLEEKRTRGWSRIGRSGPGTGSWRRRSTTGSERSTGPARAGTSRASFSRRRR